MYAIILRALPAKSMSHEEQALELMVILADACRWEFVDYR